MRLLVLVGLSLSLMACSTLPSPVDRMDNAQKMADAAGWESAFMVTDTFTLRAYLPRHPPDASTLTIYLEGDGLAWINSSTPSFDPTPVNPLALKLALRDPTLSAYLARPCQFLGEEQKQNCSMKYWTSHRFAPEVVVATSQAIDQLKQRLGAKQIILVGYSGGGAVATLLAARRHDVVRLLTVAGNLDPAAWASKYHLSPLSGSLNPADDWQKLQEIPQTHFVGGKDKTIDESIVRAFAARFPAGHAPSVVAIPDFDHYCCWVERWPALKRQSATLSRH